MPSFFWGRESVGECTICLSGRRQVALSSHRREEQMAVAEKKLERTEMHSPPTQFLQPQRRGRADMAPEVPRPTLLFMLGIGYFFGSTVQQRRNSQKWR